MIIGVCLCLIELRYLSGRNGVRSMHGPEGRPGRSVGKRASGKFPEAVNRFEPMLGAPPGRYGVSAGRPDQVTAPKTVTSLVELVKLLFPHRTLVAAPYRNH